MSSLIQVLWYLRSKLAYVIDNIYYYLQVDVIECQFSILIKKIKESKSYKAIDIAHKLFIQSIITQSFLSQPSIKNDIDYLIKLSMEYSLLIHNTEYKIYIILEIY